MHTPLVFQYQLALLWCSTLAFLLLPIFRRFDNAQGFFEAPLELGRGKHPLRSPLRVHDCYRHALARLRVSSHGQGHGASHNFFAVLLRHPCMRQCFACFLCLGVVRVHKAYDVVSPVPGHGVISCLKHCAPCQHLMNARTLPWTPSRRQCISVHCYLSFVVSLLLFLHRF